MDEPDTVADIAHDDAPGPPARHAGQPGPTTGASPGGPAAVPARPHSTPMAWHSVSNPLRVRL